MDRETETISDMRMKIVGGEGLTRNIFKRDVLVSLNNSSHMRGRIKYLVVGRMGAKERYFGKRGFRQKSINNRN